MTLPTTTGSRDGLRPSRSELAARDQTSLARHHLFTSRSRLGLGSSRLPGSARRERLAEIQRRREFMLKALPAFLDQADSLGLSFAAMVKDPAR